MTESVPNNDPGYALVENDDHSPLIVWTKMTEVLLAGENTP